MSSVKLENMYWKSHPDWEAEFKDVDDEEYKLVRGYHGSYFISNYGKVISFKKRLPLLLCNSLKNGFLAINLSYLGVFKLYYIHDLVYTHFVGKLKPGHRVMHKNNIVIDNYYKNLYTVHKAALTGKIEKFYDLSRLSAACLANLPEAFRTVKVLQFTKKGKFVREHSSIFEAAQRSGATPEGVNDSLRGYQKSCGGFQWRFKKGFNSKNEISAVTPVKYKKPKLYQGKTVCQFDLDGKFIREYPSSSEAARQIGVSKNSIHLGVNKKVKRIAGYQWRFKSDVVKEGKIMAIEPAKKRKIVAPRAKKSKRMSSRSIPDILQFHLEGAFIQNYHTTKEANLQSGVSSYYILKCLKGEIKSAGGYQWRFRDDPLFREGIVAIPPVESPFKKTPVVKFDLKGNYVNEYPFVEMAAAKSAASTNSVIFCLSGTSPTAGGFQWRLRSDPIFKDGIVDIPPVDLRTFKLLNRKPVLQFGLNGTFFRSYAKTAEAARGVGISLPDLKEALLKKKATAGGFQWRFFTDPIFKDDIVDIEAVKAAPVFDDE